MHEKNDMMAINNQNLQQSMRQRNTLCSQCMRTPAFYPQFSPFMSMGLPHHLPLGSGSRNSIVGESSSFSRGIPGPEYTVIAM